METPGAQAVEAARSGDRSEARWVRYALKAALALSAVLPFFYVRKFGVNALFWDQFEFVPALARFYEGQLSLWDLTALHNEHRLFFPRLIMLGLAALTRYDNVAEMYFNAGLLVALGAVLLHIHVRTFGASNRSLLAFLPVPVLLFTWRQYENLLWGWQLQITLCALCAVVSLWLLEGVRDVGARWAGATAAAFVATFSFGSGTLLWPLGLVLMFWRGRREGRMPWRAMGAWTAVAAVSGVMYVWDYQRPDLLPDPWHFLRHPVGSVYFLLATLGSSAADHASTAAAFGTLLLVAGGVVALELRRKRAAPGPLPLATGLLLFALATAVLVLIGRSGFGRDFGVTSRYTTLTLFAFIGLHRAILALEDPTRRGLLTGLLLAATVSCGFASFIGGVSAGYSRKAMMGQHRQVLLTFEHRGDHELERLFFKASDVRERAALLKRLKLNAFATEP
jgi:hypothetical protein